MRRSLARFLLLPLLLLPFLAPAASAGTLDDVVKRGTVKVGIDLGVPPYGLTDANQKPAGYDVEVAELFAKDLGVKLEIVPLTGPNRVPFLLTNKVDVVIATFGITPQRALSVSFSNPYVALSPVVLGPKDKPIGTMAETKGMKVGITRGTTQDLDFTRLAPQGSQIIRFEDDATTTAALLSGRSTSSPRPTCWRPKSPSATRRRTSTSSSPSACRRGDRGAPRRCGLPAVGQHLRLFPQAERRLRPPVREVGRLQDARTAGVLTPLAHVNGAAAHAAAAPCRGCPIHVRLAHLHRHRLRAGGQAGRLPPPALFAPHRCLG